MNTGRSGVATGLTNADQREVDFIRKWIFPGGFLPTVSYVTESIHKGGKNRLVIDSISNIGVSSSGYPSSVRLLPFPPRLNEMAKFHISIFLANTSP